MQKIKKIKQTRHLFLRLSVFIAVVFLLVAAALPLMPSRQASAVELTSRSLTMTTAIPSQGSVSYTFSFTIGSGSTGTLQSLKFVACTTAIATYGLASTASTSGCTSPSSININSTTVTFANQTGFQGATNFAPDATGAGFCTPAANVLCAKRTDATNQTGSSAKTIKFSNITNSSSANTAFFVGIYTYSDNAYGTPVDSGTVAGAVVQSLLVTAQVAEILQFCVGASTVDDISTTAIGSTCSGAPGASSTVGLGTLDPTSISVSPVTASPNGGSNTNGIAILRTNATNGTSVYYDAVQSSSGSGNLGSLRIQSASTSCSGTSTTDGCINSKGATQGTFTAGTENFGFTIAGVSCVTEQTYSGAYACSYTGATEHLVPQTNYVGQTNTYGTTNGYAFVDSGTNTLIAQAASSNVVSDEALIMKFAATPAISTPFGSYSVNIDYTVVPTF